MNKRIKKKRAQTSPRYIDHMVSLLKHYLIPRIYFTSLDPNKSSIHIWRKKNIKHALKYMYRRRNQYSSTKYIRFAGDDKHE